MAAPVQRSLFSFRYLSSNFVPKSRFMSLKYFPINESIYGLSSEQIEVSNLVKINRDNNK